MLESLCNHELSAVCRHRCDCPVASLSLLFVSSLPAHGFLIMETSYHAYIYACMPLVHAHQIFSQCDLYFKMAAILFYLYLPLLPTCLDFELSYLAHSDWMPESCIPVFRQGYKWNKEHENTAFRSIKLQDKTITLFSQGIQQMPHSKSCISFRLPARTWTLSSRGTTCFHGAFAVHLPKS